MRVDIKRIKSFSSLIPTRDLDFNFHMSGSDGMYMNPMAHNFVSSHSAPSEIAEEAARRREIRLSKNREAARECRRKKKEYVKCLENRVQVLEGEIKLH